MANGLNFNIGMSVPGASSLYNAPSAADQVQNETAEQRRKRLQAMAQAAACRRSPKAMAAR